MTTPNEILRRARELDDPERIKLLWFLHSLVLSEARTLGDDVYARLREFHVDRTPEGALNYVLHSGYGRATRQVEKILLEYMRRSEQLAAKDYFQTNIGRAVWDTLDFCLEEHRPCFIEGLEGRGKSASARAWFDAHRGQARYVSLPGLGVQRDFFAALANAYGQSHSHAKAANEIRFPLRDIIVRSGLVLIIDEAHFALPERSRKGRPPLIDWIDTELCNAGVAVALISTPQFGSRLSEFEERTTWRAGQFRRRFSGRWCRLDEKTSEADLTALAQKVLPEIGAKGIKLAVGYAGTFGRDVSGLFDLVRDSQRRVRLAGRSDVTYRDLLDAYKLDRVPTENAIARAFTRPSTRRPDSFTPLQPDRSQAAATAPADRSERTAESTSEEFPQRGLQPVHS